MRGLIAHTPAVGTQRSSTTNTILPHTPGVTSGKILFVRTVATFLRIQDRVNAIWLAQGKEEAVLSMNGKRSICRKHCHMRPNTSATRRQCLRQFKVKRFAIMVLRRRHSDSIKKVMVYTHAATCPFPECNEVMETERSLRARLAFNRSFVPHECRFEHIQRYTSDDDRLVAL